MPKVNRLHLFAYRCSIPPIEEQKRIAHSLDALDGFIETISTRSSTKLAALDALRASLFQQAFSGQLEAIQSRQVPSAAVSFPATLPNITTTDLHAGLLAMAYAQHEANGKLTLFTHVKAEKIAHMIEAHAGIELGRWPVKDAAGPNDFPHLRKVEHRAKKANYFDFRRLDGGAYRVHKLNGFDRLITRTRGVLGDRTREVDQLLRWMTPMTVRKAELVATVFAAWNNLLLSGKQPSDEQIVAEARENWHAKKLTIDRRNFFAVLNQLRNAGIEPLGRGKYIGPKTERA
jgi:hypothetical protein